MFRNTLLIMDNFQQVINTSVLHRSNIYSRNINIHEYYIHAHLKFTKNKRQHFMFMYLQVSYSTVSV